MQSELEWQNVEQEHSGLLALSERGRRPKRPIIHRILPKN